jgi:dTDP-4-amino-4,6-dideoxygalactose transaminase
MISVLSPSTSDKMIEEMTKVLKSGWWGQGPKTFEFEKKFAEYVGAKYAIGINSGTAALDLCLKVYGIKGGELITTPFTFVADAIVGEWNGMDVTFADIDEDSFCLDPEKLVITNDTRAIIAVDSHGRLADIEGIRKKATRDIEGVGSTCPLIIEDAAHAMYTPGAGKKADITIWSFQAVKTLPTGDGGMITTNDDRIYSKLRTLTWLGVEKSTYERAEGKRYTWDYDITQSQGIKAYMNDLTAVIGLVQLERLEEMTAKRRAIQTRYNEAFADIKEIKAPMYSHTVQYYTMKCERRDELSDFLATNGIATSVHFKVLHEMTYWKKAKKRPLPIADKVWVQLLSLPLHDNLTWVQVEYIIGKVREFYGK